MLTHDFSLHNKQCDPFICLVVNSNNFLGVGNVGGGFPTSSNGWVRLVISPFELIWGDLIAIGGWLKVEEEIVAILVKRSSV